MKQSIEINKSTKGITLIALVITIIVLLILAGVTIATLAGENGILTKANQASEKTKQANAEEQVKLAIQASYGTDAKINMNDLNTELSKIEGLTYKDNPISDTNKISSLPDKVKVDGYEVTINADGSVTVGDTIDEDDNLGTTIEGVTIPKGFYYVGGTKATGIVISDHSEDENKGTSWEVAKTLKGNQFVWVPVENDADFKTYEGYYEGQADSQLDDCEEPYANGYVNEGSEYNAMKSSVLEHNGFYVGRYEAGIESASERNGNSGIADEVVIKQGKNTYNYIGWADSNDMTNQTGGAVQKAKEFASKNGYTFVTSTLIYGVQWDAIMQWIDSGYKNEDSTLTSFVADSTGKGNYDETENKNSWKGTLAKTGVNADYAVNNIYDLAGNVVEWTMESYDSSARITRGGSYYNTGISYPSSKRDGTDPGFINDCIGFRIALYL